MSGLVVQSERKLLSIPVILSHKGNLKRPLCTLTEATVGLGFKYFSPQENISPRCQH